MGSFQTGATISLPNQILKDTSSGEYYRWDGALPKVVSAGSAPSSAGGTGVGTWLSVGDSVLRSMLSSKDGYSYLGELQSVADFFDLVKSNGSRVKLRSWFAGWSSTS